MVEAALGSGGSCDRAGASRSPWHHCSPKLWVNVKFSLCSVSDDEPEFWPCPFKRTGSGRRRHGDSECIVCFTWVFSIALVALYLTFLFVLLLWRRFRSRVYFSPGHFCGATKTITATSLSERGRFITRSLLPFFVQHKGHSHSVFIWRTWRRKVWQMSESVGAHGSGLRNIRTKLIIFLHFIFY